MSKTGIGSFALRITSMKLGEVELLPLKEGGGSEEKHRGKPMTGKEDDTNDILAFLCHNE